MTPIDCKSASAFIRKHHYSRKIVPNSQLHFGVFWQGRLEGAMQFGPSMRKEYMLHLVSGTGWNQLIELNRLAFTEALPRNSESRALSVVLRMLRKHYTHLKWLISFADATQCGDGAIYRATGFLLTQINENDGIRKNPATGRPITRMAAYHLKKAKEFESWPVLKGYQLRYIYFLDSTWRSRLTVPVLAYSEIERAGAGMYRGRRSGEKP